MTILRYTTHCTLLLLTGFAWPIYTSYQENFSKKMLSIYEGRFTALHSVFHNYAVHHDKHFPDGKTSNEAFRKLFQGSLVDDESLFLIADQPEPDQYIGTAETGFREALEPGECNLYYVRGLKFDHHAPKMPWIFTLIKTRWQNYWVYIGADFQFSGRGRIVLPSYATGYLDAEKVNLLSPDYWKQFGVVFNDVLAPEGPKEDPMVLSPTAQANRRVRWLIFIPYGLFLIADFGYACLAKRRRKSLPMKPAQ